MGGATSLASAGASRSPTESFRSVVQEGDVGRGRGAGAVAPAPLLSRNRGVERPTLEGGERLCSNAKQPIDHNYATQQWSRGSK